MKFRLSPRVEDAENNSIENFGDKLKSLDLDGLDDNFEVVESTKKKDQIKVKGKGFTKSKTVIFGNSTVIFGNNTNKPLLQFKRKRFPFALENQRRLRTM